MDASLVLSIKMLFLSRISLIFACSIRLLSKSPSWVFLASLMASISSSFIYFFVNRNLHWKSCFPSLLGLWHLLLLILPLITLLILTQRLIHQHLQVLRVPLLPYEAQSKYWINADCGFLIKKILLGSNKFWSWARALILKVPSEM